VAILAKISVSVYWGNPGFFIRKTIRLFHFDGGAVDDAETTGTRKGHSAANLAIIRHIALNLIKNIKSQCKNKGYVIVNCWSL
jgi:hypothetical protein